MNLENKYTRRMLGNFPRNFGFVDNKRDPLHILMNSGSILLSDLERTRKRNIQNLSIDACNPVQMSGVYYINLSNDNINNIEISASGDVEIVEDMVDFLGNDVTGFELIEEIEPSGISPSGILGVSYGFDWDSPNYYITPSGSDYVYAYDDFEGIPTLIDYSIRRQCYDVTGLDEYIQFRQEIAGSGNLPSGVSQNDVVKVAYLQHEPVENTVVIIDTNNLQDPEDSNSDGIMVNLNDYAVTGNRIVFVPERPDYNPATILDYGTYKKYLYPSGYQPDKNFDSVFIVEYDYKVSEKLRYLTQEFYLHNLGLKGRPHIY